MTVAALPNFNIIRDLVPDLVPMFGVHQRIKPYIIRKDAQEMEKPSAEYFQSPHQLEEFLQFTYCIKCGVCMAACPTMATDRQYPGPMPLTQVYRYNTDSRDDGGGERKDLVAKCHGVFGCHYAGECSNACPKGVDPARAIQLLKRDLVQGLLTFGEGSCLRQDPSPAAECGTEAQDRGAAVYGGQSVTGAGKRRQIGGSIREPFSRENQRSAGE